MMSSERCPTCNGMTHVIQCAFYGSHAHTGTGCPTMPCPSCAGKGVLWHEVGTLSNRWRVAMKDPRCTHTPPWLMLEAASGLTMCLPCLEDREPKAFDQVRAFVARVQQDERMKDAQQGDR